MSTRQEKELNTEEISNFLIEMCEKSRIASKHLSLMNSHEKNNCLVAMAEAIERDSDDIIKANKKDLKNGEEKGLSSALLDRLMLDKKRIKAMADGLKELVSLEDPVGKIISYWVRPNGLLINKVSVPIGVICIIYESRPNVTVDAAGLCFKAGNAVILRGGSESINSNLILSHVMNRAGVRFGLPDGAIQLVPWTDRSAVNQLLKMDNYIDLVIPRGGESLIRMVVEQSTIPVIKHYKGICHIYVDEKCSFDMALSIIENAKCQRPGVCNAVETVLIHQNIAKDFVPRFYSFLDGKDVEMRGDPEFLKYAPNAKTASEKDWFTEYLELILSVKIVSSLTEAIDHINFYGSKHSDAIITDIKENAERFMREVDSATVYVNASTRFTDGVQFGMGAEIGISTDKLHARGPMGLPELTTYKYLIYGNGQIRV